MEDDFGISNETELVAGDVLDGLWVAFELLHLFAELPNVFGEFSVFRLDLGHFGFELTESRQTLAGQHEGRRADSGDQEDEER